MRQFLNAMLLSATVSLAASAQDDYPPIRFEQPPPGSLLAEQLGDIAMAIRAIESNPTAANIADVRTGLMTWIVSSPDISVSVCGFPANKVMDSKSQFHSELFAQFILGMAAHKIESPADAEDHVKVSIGGITSAIVLYESYRGLFGEEAKDKFLDRLLKERSKGTLDKYLTKRIKPC